MEDADRIVGLYERHAHAFDRIRGRDLFEKHWLDRFTASLPTGGTVLDIGCGSGEPMAAELISRGFRLTGIDSAATLIGLCRARFPEHHWYIGDMRHLTLGVRFDALLAWHSFFHLTGQEQRAMFVRFAAHAEKGAMLMFTSGPGEGEAIGTFEGEPLYHASLAPEAYRRLLEGNGFELVAHVPEDPSCGGATVWLARRV